MLKPVLLAAALALSPAAFAQTAAEPVAVLVVVPTPPGIDRATIVAGMEKSVPLYKSLPGLVRKTYTVSERGFGGMYLWSSRAAAEGWFNAAWRAKAKATYGAEPEVTYFDAPIAIEGGKP